MALNKIDFNAWNITNMINTYFPILKNTFYIYRLLHDAVALSDPDFWSDNAEMRLLIVNLIKELTINW